MIEVIHVAASRGDGSSDNPERLIDLYFALSGELLACHDPLNGPADGFDVAQASAAQHRRGE